MVKKINIAVSYVIRVTYTKILVALYNGSNNKLLLPNFYIIMLIMENFMPGLHEFEISEISSTL